MTAPNGAVLSWLGVATIGRKLWGQRLRLLALAGVGVPAVMAFLGYLLAYVLRGDLPDLARPPGWWALAMGVATAAVSMAIVYLVYKSNKHIEKALRETGVRVGEDALRMAGYPVMLVVVSMAGLGEEILFRGGLQPSIGIIPAALLFGFSHGGWRRDMWAYAVVASLSGGLFGLVYHLTGDLWVPIIAHMLHNLAATVLLGRNISSEGLFPLEPEPWEMPDAVDEAVEPAEGQAGEQEPAGSESITSTAVDGDVVPVRRDPE